jgi:mannose-6-phosphate isomerase-like protein (cupin superfamily)
MIKTVCQKATNKTPYVVNKANVVPRDTGDGERIYELAGPIDGNIHKHCIAIVDIDPGKSSKNHFHPEVEETYFVLAGSALVTVDGVDVVLGQGDLIAIPTSAHHKVTNSSNTEVLQLYVTCAEPWTPECSVFLE